jgi:hypothetical protein
MFFVLFSLFSSTKWENRRGNKSCPGARTGTSGSGKMMGKGGRRVNTVQTMCTHVGKCKMLPVETTSRIGRG